MFQSDLSDLFLRSLTALLVPAVSQLISINALNALNNLVFYGFYSNRWFTETCMLNLI